MKQRRYRQAVWLAAVLALLFGAVAPLSAIAAEAVAMPSSKRQPGAGKLVAQTSPVTVGFVETVIVNPGNLRIDAKIDTGARTSSVDTTNILPYLRDGKQHVRFTLVADGNERRYFDMPVLRVAVIKRANSPPQRRFVVEMEICLAGANKRTEVNLIDRKGMAYRMLIGRQYIAGQFVVDPKGTFLTRPDCGVR